MLIQKEAIYSSSITKTVSNIHITASQSGQLCTTQVLGAVPGAGDPAVDQMHTAPPIADLPGSQEKLPLGQTYTEHKRSWWCPQRSQLEPIAPGKGQCWRTEGGAGRGHKVHRHTNAPLRNRGDMVNVWLMRVTDRMPSQLPRSWHHGLLKWEKQIWVTGWSGAHIWTWTCQVWDAHVTSWSATRETSDEIRRVFLATRVSLSIHRQYLKP